MSEAMFTPDELRILRGWAPSGRMTHIGEPSRSAQMALRDKLDSFMRILYPEPLCPHCETTHPRTSACASSGLPLDAPA